MEASGEVSKIGMIFSARLNDDGSWRGLGWARDRHIAAPLIIVGINDKDYYWDRKDAIRAAKLLAREKGLI